MRRQAELRRVGTALVVATVGCSTPATEAPAEGEWGDATVVEELSIGVEAGAEEYMFGRVHSVAVAADGMIYVADSRPIVVRAYSEDGTFRGRIGREGQGPGEYAAAPRLQVLPDGTLVMWDLRGRRISLLSTEGEYLRSFSVAAGTGRLFTDVSGDYYLRASSVRDEREFELVRYSADGEELGRVTLPPEGDGSRSFVLGSEGNLSSFAVLTRSRWSPLGYAITGRNDTYDIELRKPSGTVHLRRDIDPIRVRSEERAEWEAFRQRFLGLMLASDLDADLNEIPIAKPFFREVHVGQDGRVWVFRYVAAEKRHDVNPLPQLPERPLLTWREPWTYDVFESDGTFLGSVVVPELFWPFVFRGEQMWGSLTDEDGVERVMRLRVVPEAR